MYYGRCRVDGRCLDKHAATSLTTSTASWASTPSVTAALSIYAMTWLGQPWEKGNIDFTLLDWHEILAGPVSQATILDVTPNQWDILQRAEADGDPLDYPGLMLLQISTAPILFSSVMGCTASLSDDSSALDGILPQNLLEQDNLDCEARWDWVICPDQKNIRISDSFESESLHRQPFLMQ